MISSLLEVANALVITYYATEYLLKDNFSFRTLQQATRSHKVGVLVWLLVNVGSFLSKLVLSGGGGLSSEEGGKSGSAAFHFHLPSQLILFVVVASFTALAWWDIHRIKPEVTLKTFARQICVSTLESLLILPVVSVGVALCFLVLIGFLDMVHTSTVWLNNPIYYGVLYGPFSTVYFFTKRRCIKNRGHILPL